VLFTYYHNCNQAYFPSHYPRAIFNAGRMFQVAESYACRELGHDPFAFTQQESHTPPADVAELRNKILDSRHSLPFSLAVLTDIGDLNRGRLSRDFYMEVDWLMSMQIVGAWTAFETLFGDLWEAALNAHPEGLADLKGKSKQKVKGDDDGRRMVQISLLQKFKYDLSKVMGTMLKDKVDFTSLNGARDAYALAFWEHADSIHEALANPAFRAISAMRNLIVHKAGICDTEYERNSKGLQNLIPHLEPGCILTLDGEILARTLVPALKCAMQLIRAVDAWIVAKSPIVPAAQEAPDPRYLD